MKPFKEKFEEVDGKWQAKKGGGWETKPNKEDLPPNAEPWLVNLRIWVGEMNQWAEEVNKEIHALRDAVTKLQTPPREPARAGR